MVNTTVLAGADSVNAPSEPNDLAFFVFYTAGSFANGTATKQDHPNKLYIGLTPTVADISGADGCDVEAGDLTNFQVAQFIRGANPPNTNLPVVYTSESNVNSLQSDLTAVGISRGDYYLFQADWDGVGSIPDGCDLAQYQDVGTFDRDSAYAYVFKAYNVPVPTPVPEKQEGTVHSDTTGGNARVYSVDAGQTWTFHKPDGF
jgi:hypothetical protein